MVVNQRCDDELTGRATDRLVPSRATIRVMTARVAKAT